MGKKKIMASNELKKFDLIVIGGGPGGYTAAIRGSQEKLSTALVETTDKLGGICLNWGCIPTKSLLKSAEVYEQVLHAEEYGITTGEVNFRWSEIINRSRQIAHSFANGINFLMKKNGIQVYHGKGVLEGEGRVRVEGENKIILTAENIIVATGASPQNIAGIDIERDKIITSKEALTLNQQPKSIVIMGAGAIGSEFASFFNSFGARVTLIEMLDSIVPTMDTEISKRLSAFFRRRGIDVITSSTIEKIAINGNKCSVYVRKVGGKENSEILECDKVLISAGSSGNVDGIGLEKAGVSCKNGFITVDNSCKTTAQGIWAIGDCIGPPLLAHAAAMEAECAIDSITGKKPLRPDSYLIPLCIYSKPHVSSVGFTEKEAHKFGYDVVIGKCPFRSIGQAVVMGEPDGFVKVIVDRKKGTILGTHIIGAGANEIIQEIVLAMYNNITAERFIKTIHPHPTLSEAVKEAVAGALGKSINI
jgi:dihydrolipoamide dehydrogenase